MGRVPGVARPRTTRPDDRRRRRVARNNVGRVSFPLDDGEANDDRDRLMIRGPNSSSRLEEPHMSTSRRPLGSVTLPSLALLFVVTAPAPQPWAAEPAKGSSPQRPNIVFLFGDDSGI